MREILWIDSGCMDAKHNVTCLFPELWNKDIRSNVLGIAGSDADMNTFVYECYIDWLCSKGDAIYSEEKREVLYPLILKDKSIEYTGSDCCKSVNTHEAADVIAEIPEGINCIMLALCLEDRDFVDIAKQRKCVMLSMQLYHALKTKYHVLLWVQLAPSLIVAKTWVDLYKEAYPEDEVPTLYDYKGTAITATKPEKLWDTVERYA